MKLPIQTNMVRALLSMALMAGLSLAISSKATVPVSDLPDFDNLPNFAQLGNQIDDSSVTVNGNAGVSESGLLNFASPSTIEGDAFVGNSATFNNLGHLTGSVFTSQDLTTEQNTVFSASEGLDALPADDTISSDQTTGLSFDVPSGEVFVVDLNGGLNLNDENISLTGGGQLVLNILGSFSLSGTSTISDEGQNIFVNYLGTDTVTTGPDNVIDAQVFIPNAAADLEGTWNGGIFSGDQTITMSNESTINAVPVAEPGTIALAAMGGLSMIFLRRRLGMLKNSI